MIVRALLSLLVGGVLFVVLWAGLNFAFGMALDGPIGAFFMGQPCQLLDGSSEPLTGYTPGRAGGRGRRSSPSVCHFGPRSVVVGGPTDGLGFREREFQLLVVGLVGYGVCLVAAGVGTFYLIVQAWELLGRLGRRFRRSAAQPAPAPPRRRRR